MTFCRILMHDLRCGIFRLRFLAVPFALLIPLAEFHWLESVYDVSGTSMDMLLYIFKGTNPVSALPGTGERVELPLSWLLIMGLPLLLNIDYILNDLALSGQQIIIRCGKRLQWYLSKCVWSVLCTCFYFFLLVLGVSGFACLTGRRLSLSVSLDTVAALFEIQGLDAFSLQKTILIGVVMPCVTMMALNLLEMTLCLFMKPVLSFLSCVGVLVLAVYCDNGFVLGNGAMTVRNLAGSAQWASVRTVLVSASLILAGCVIFGTIRFAHMDILSKED